jgi:hypothetical protein
LRIKAILILLETTELKAVEGLTPTSQAVLQLAKTLPYSTYEFTLFLDNYFCNTELFLKLRELGISACKTVRKSIIKKLFPTFVGVKGVKTTPMDWALLEVR